MSAMEKGAAHEKNLAQDAIRFRYAVRAEQAATRHRIYKKSGDIHEIESLAAGLRGRRPRHPGRVGASADRHQVQPRSRRRHAQGQGRRALQGTGRKSHQGPGQGRSLSEQHLVQGQGRNGSAAAGRGANAGAVRIEVRSARRQGIRSIRLALHLPRQGGAVPRHRRTDRQELVQETGGERYYRPRVLGQWLQGDVGQQAAAPSGRLQGSEDAHPVVQGA